MMDMEFRKKIKTVIYGCDICQISCPYNRGIDNPLASDIDPELAMPELLPFLEPVSYTHLSGNSNYLYGLAVAEAYRGQGYGSYLAKSVVNQLIAQNDKSFQIAVEDSNVAAKRLYEKIGFVKQTQVVYLKQKG